MASFLKFEPNSDQQLFYKNIQENIKIFKIFNNLISYFNSWNSAVGGSLLHKYM